MATHRRKLTAGLAAFLAFSLFVCVATGGASARGPGRQIEFTPHVSPLEMTQTAQATQLGSGEGERVQIADGVWRVEGLSSSEAMERCGGDAFTYGDAQAGMCLVPGGETYYIWIGRGEVLGIEAIPGDQNQADFRVAVEAMASDREDIDRDTISLGLGIGGLLASGIGLIPACASIIGCYLGTGAVMLAVGAVASGNGNLMQDRDDLAQHTSWRSITIADCKGTMTSHADSFGEDMMKSGEPDDAARGPLHTTLKAGFISVGLAVLAVAVRLEGWQVFFAVVAAGALVAGAYLGAPARIVDYVTSRRGTGYRDFFSVAVPLLLAAGSSYGVWLTIYVGTLLGDWRWTDVAAPVIYGIAAIINIVVLIMNARALRRRAAG
jgi:hypothetical protein